MTKQEKVAAWMEGLGFEPEKQPAESYAMWSNGVLRLSHVQATFFYDVMVEARIDELLQVPLYEHPTLTAQYKVKRCRHLKQEGKTNGL